MIFNAPKTCFPGCSRSGYSWVEVLAVIVILLLLFALLMPGLGHPREASYRMTCAFHLKQLGLALHNYHDMYRTFPPAIMGHSIDRTLEEGNFERMSGLVLLLPYLEQSNLYEQNMEMQQQEDRTQLPWHNLKVEQLLCPTASRFVHGGNPTNYAFCIGDSVQILPEPSQATGAFGGSLARKFTEFTDGTSYTILMGEIAIPRGLALQGQIAIDQPRAMLNDPRLCWQTRDSKTPYYLPKVALHPQGRGWLWEDGIAGMPMFNTLLPPNAPSCAVGGSDGVDGIYSAGSYHVGGSQVLFADGSSRFIAENINAKQKSDGASRNRNPYGVWGALGTVAGEEELDARNY